MQSVLQSCPLIMMIVSSRGGDHCSVGFARRQTDIGIIYQEQRCIGVSCHHLQVVIAAAQQGGHAERAARLGVTEGGPGTAGSCAHARCRPGGASAGLPPSSILCRLRRRRCRLPFSDGSSGGRAPAEDAGAVVVHVELVL